MEVTRRRSRKRDAILSCIRGTTIHPSAEWIYEQLKPRHPDLSLGTVYRNLALFRQDGEVICVATVDGVERLDARTEPHAHFICEKCQAVTDMDIPGEDLRESLAERYGVEVHRHELLFRGLCAKCNA